MPRHPHKPRKWVGFVESFTSDSIYIRVWHPVPNGQYPEEFWLDIPRSLWPADKPLVKGAYFSVPGKRGPGEIHVIDRPFITKRRIKKARIEARKWMKLFGSQLDPVNSPSHPAQ